MKWKREWKLLFGVGEELPEGSVPPFPATTCTWVVVKIMVPFWVPTIIRHLIFRVSKKGP